MKLTESRLKQLIKEEIEAVEEQMEANSVMDQIITNQGIIIKLLKDVREFQTGSRPQDLREQEEVSARVVGNKMEGNVVVVTVEGNAPERVKGKKAEGRAKFRGNIGLARQAAASKARQNLLKGKFVD